MRVEIEGAGALHGRVEISGAKNAATRMLAAALLTDDPVTLTRFPVSLGDVQSKAAFLRALGAEVSLDPAAEQVSVRTAALRFDALADYRVPIRTTYLLAAGQLRVCGRARIPYPRGCALGERKHDLHLMVWRRLGCEVTEHAEYLELRAPRLVGADIEFPITTVGGTETGLLCGAIAQGVTRLRNAYVTPEVRNLIEMLEAMGVVIRRVGSGGLEIEGGQRLRGVNIAVLPDRIEAVTWLVLVALSGGELSLGSVPVEELEIPLIHLRAAGVDLRFEEGRCVVRGLGLSGGGLQPFEVACGTYPGVVSDMQPFFVLLALGASGRSLVYDYRYPARTEYLRGLERFVPGCLEWTPGRIRIRGGNGFAPARVESTDLRGGMAMVLAAVLASGRSTVHRVQDALRGYDRLAAKLASVGVRAQWVDEAPTPSTRR